MMEMTYKYLREPSFLIRPMGRNLWSMRAGENVESLFYGAPLTWMLSALIDKIAARISLNLHKVVRTKLAPTAENN